MLERRKQNYKYGSHNYSFGVKTTCGARVQAHPHAHVCVCVCVRPCVHACDCVCVRLNLSLKVLEPFRIFYLFGREWGLNGLVPIATHAFK